MRQKNRKEVILFEGRSGAVHFYVAPEAHEQLASVPGFLMPLALDILYLFGHATCSPRPYTAIRAEREEPDPAPEGILALLREAEKTVESLCALCAADQEFMVFFCSGGDVQPFAPRQPLMLFLALYQAPHPFPWTNIDDASYVRRMVDNHLLGRGWTKALKTTLSSALCFVEIPPETWGVVHTVEPEGAVWKPGLATPDDFIGWKEIVWLERGGTFIRAAWGPLASPSPFLPSLQERSAPSPGSVLLLRACGDIARAAEDLSAMEPPCRVDGTLVMAASERSVTVRFGEGWRPELVRSAACQVRWREVDA